MSRQPKYSKQEHSRRGEEIYDRNIRPTAENAHRGQFIAIDIDSGAFEIDPDELMSCNRLLARLPDAQIWLKKVGSPHVRHFGPRARSTAP
jgi:hypothetical protein